MKCSQEGPHRCNACIVSNLNLCVSMVENIADASSNCSEDTTSASFQDYVQGLNYIPRSEGDKNTNTSDGEVEISFESSTNKPMKKPYVRGVPNPSAKVSFFFEYHSSGLFIHLSIFGV